MSQKWNLQDIKPAAPRKKRSPAEVDPVKVEPPREIERKEEMSDEVSLHVTDGRKKKSRSLFYALIVFFVIMAGGVIASILMQGAELTVYPRHKEPNINATFTANREPKPDELTYEIMTLEAEGERQVTASGQEEVKSQAEGTILIYNKHQTDPIRLVTNTRFETESGLIFKIKDSAVVPGYTIDNEGQIAPGVTTAEVYADEVGDQYNVGPSTFKIPGFKNYPEYKTVYAESVETMTGGFSGQKFIIDENELKTAKQALQMELRNSLLERVDSELPAGFVKFDGAVTFTYVSLPSVEYGDNLATIKEKALLRIPLFPEEEFADYIAAASIPGYEGEPVRIHSYDSFKFGYTSATTSASDISTVNSITFKLVGKPQIIWKFDEGKLKTDLLNANKTALPSILGAYPAIEKAEAVIRPFWKSKFPTDMAHIEIIEVLPDNG